MKPTIPINAIPPATESPTMVDVLTPLLEPPDWSWSEFALGLADADDDCEGVTVVNTVIVSPSLLIEIEADTDTCGGLA
jgi:hypothetical protein